MVAMNDIVAVVREIGRVFAPDRVILFGSHAVGRPTSDSDVDLLVVMRHGHDAGDGYKTATAIRNRIDIPFPADILVRSPAEIRERLRLNDFFIRDILSHGKILYEAGNHGVGAKSRRRLRQHAPRPSGAKVSKL